MRNSIGKHYCPINTAKSRPPVVVAQCMTDLQINSDPCQALHVLAEPIPIACRQWAIERQAQHHDHSFMLAVQVFGYKESLKNPSKSES